MSRNQISAKLFHTGFRHTLKQFGTSEQSALKHCRDCLSRTFARWLDLAASGFYLTWQTECTTSYLPPAHQCFWTIRLTGKLCPFTRTWWLSRFKTLDFTKSGFSIPQILRYPISRISAPLHFLVWLIYQMNWKLTRYLIPIVPPALT